MCLGAAVSRFHTHTFVLRRFAEKVYAHTETQNIRIAILFCVLRTCFANRLLRRRSGAQVNCLATTSHGDQI